MDRLKSLVLLKLRLLLRQGRGPWQVVAWVMVLALFILPLGGGLAVFAFAGFSLLDETGHLDLLTLMLSGLLGFWLVFPLVGFSLNQSYDLTRLFIYPLSRVTIFLGNLFACFLDPSLLLAVPLLGVVVYTYSTSALAVAFEVVALLLFLAQMLAFSQALLWALLGLLRTRRARDWAMLIAPLIALTAYMAPHFALGASATANPFRALVAWHPARYLQFAPSGLTARAVECAARGRWPWALAYLAGSGAYLLAALAAGAWALSRLHAGEIGEYRAPCPAGVCPDEPTLVQRLATTPLAALALKEARYYWRDPRLKSLFLAPLFPIVFILGTSLARRHALGGLPGGLPPTFGIIFTAFVVLMSFGSLFQNTFGADREGLRVLFLAPCRREDILLGKNLTAVGVAWVAASVAVLVAGALLGDLTLAATLVPFILATAVVLAAVGNIVSIHFPIRIARRGENPFAASAGRGCTNALVSMVALYLALLVAAPIFLAAAAPRFLHAPLGYGLAVPAALVYAGALYVGALKLYSVAALQRREPNILEECLAGEHGG